MFRNILIATDGSARAEKASAYAVDLAKSTGGTLHVVSVVDDDKPRTAGEIDPDFYEEITDSPNIDIEELDLKRKQPEMEFANRIIQKATDQGVESSMIVKVGSPAEEIVKAAVELGSEVIVIGSRGRGVVGSALMGSVASGVIHKGVVPVLVIPARGED
ncbi:MAG: universal stress protein [Thermoleophilia bacterium]